MSHSHTAYYKTQLEDGLLFQDFVVDVFWNILKIPVCAYSSRVYQNKFGESAQGIEIKHDKEFKNTKNLWIEIAEKAAPRPGPYYPSGIYRDDNTWLYVIGDYNTIFIFPKNFLRLLRNIPDKYPVHENKYKTSEGFLLRPDDQRKYAAQILYPNAEKKVGKEQLDLAKAAQEIYATLTDTGDKTMPLFPDE